MMYPSERMKYVPITGDVPAIYGHEVIKKAFDASNAHGMFTLNSVRSNLFIVSQERISNN